MKIISAICLVVALGSAGFEAKAGGYEVEPNNTTATATPIGSGQSIQGNVGSVADLDNFKFVASANGSARVTFRRPVDNYAYTIATISVLDSTAAEIVSVEVYAPDGDTTFDFGITAGKTYYLEVTGCQTNGRCLTQRSEVYELSVVQLPAPFFESEPNGTLLLFNPVSVNSWIFAQHSAKTDEDIFRINLPGAGNFFAQLSRPADYYDYNISKIEILDSNGVSLSSDDVYAPDGQGRVVISTTAPKTIYLRVISCTSNGQCSFTFSNPYQIVTSFEARASLTIANVSIAEGNSGTKVMNFVVRLSQATTSAVTFNVATANTTAVAGTDYVASNLTGLSIPIGQTTKTFSVTINGDVAVEVNETFAVNVTSVVGAAVLDGKAIGTITNDD